MIINHNSISFLFTVAEGHVPVSSKNSSTICKLKWRVFQKEVRSKGLRKQQQQRVRAFESGKVPGLSLFYSLCFCVFKIPIFFSLNLRALLFILQDSGYFGYYPGIIKSSLLLLWLRNSRRPKLVWTFQSSYTGLDQSWPRASGDPEDCQYS